MTRRNRIAIVAPAASTGGGLTQLRNLLLAFRILEPEHEYLAVVNSRARSHIQDGGWEGETLLVPRMASQPVARLVWEHLRLPAPLARWNPDVLLSPTNTIPLGPGMRDGVRTGILISNALPLAPDLWRGMGAAQRTRMVLLRALTLRSMQRADRIFVQSESSRALVGSSPEKLVVLPRQAPNPSDIQRAATEQAVVRVEQNPTFVIAGDLFPYKGVEDAIRAVGSLRRQGLDLSLLICGGVGDLRYADRMRKLAADVSSERVRFLGPLPPSSVLSLMRSSVATVACSRIESLGLIYAEAMSVGSPVVAADMPAAREACEDAALYYAPGDFEDLAGKMRSLCTDPAIRSRLQVEARRRMEDVDWLAAPRRILDELLS